MNIDYLKDLLVSKKQLMKLIDEGKELAQIINKTCNIEEYFNSFKRLERIFEILIRNDFKGYFYSEKPKENWEKIQGNYFESQILLINRCNLDHVIENRNLFSDSAKQYIDNLLINQTNIESMTNTLNVYIADFDEYLEAAGLFITEREKASIGMIQRIFKIDFNRASKIMDELESLHVVGKEEGVKSREVLMSRKEFEILMNSIKTKTESRNECDGEIIQKDYDLMSGIEFEQFCSDILSKNKFFNIERTKASGDHGIDILAEKDDITYAIQCKCYSSNIGNTAIQQAHTGKSIYKCDVAVVLTNQYFTQQAIEDAKALRVKLWDRDKLNELINNANHL